MKTCTACSLVKPLSEFYRAAGSRDGYRTKCKECFAGLPSRQRPGRQAERSRAATRDGRAYLTAAEYHARAARRREERERIKAARAASPPKPRQSHAEAQARWRGYQQSRRSTPEGHARRELQRAVEAGRIVKPLHCEGCSAPTPARALHGHHEDYARPLDVRWLCTKCHVVAHDGRWGGALA